MICIVLLVAIPPGFPPHLRPPPMMMMGGGGGPPTMSAPGTVHVQPPTVALPVEGSITVFVGSLATDLHDAHIRGILEVLKSVYYYSSCKFMLYSRRNVEWSSFGKELLIQ